MNGCCHTCSVHFCLGQGRRPGFNPWFGKIPWRRKWQTMPVSLPGKPHGPRNLVGCSPWSHKELSMTERLTHTLESIIIIDPKQLAEK